MPMEELFRLARTTTVAQLLDREDFATRYAAGAPISILELLYPLMQGVRLGRRPLRRRARRHRPDVQPAARPRHPACLRPAGAVRADAADPPGHRRRREDVQEQGQPDRHHRRRPRRCSGRRCASRTRRWPRGSRCWRSSRRREGTSPRDAKRALARAIIERFHGADAAAAAQAGFDRVFIDHEIPDDVADRASSAPRTAVLHLPAALADAFGMSRSEARRLIAQGGVKVGRSDAAAPTTSTSTSTVVDEQGRPGRPPAVPPPAGRRGERARRAAAPRHRRATARSSTSPRACARSSSAPRSGRASPRCSPSAPPSPSRRSSTSRAPWPTSRRCWTA